MLKFNGVELKPEIILQTRKHFANNAQSCIDEVLRGEVRVNDFESYKAWNIRRAADNLAGKNDHTFTFLQRAYYFQTGECLALLP
jgi:hypothetical protein